MIWRIVTGASILYLLMLVFLLFQTSRDARVLFTYCSDSIRLSEVPRIHNLYLTCRHIDPCRNGLAACSSVAIIGEDAGKPKVNSAADTGSPNAQTAVIGLGSRS